jgi:hypothetical protein
MLFHVTTPLNGGGGLYKNTFLPVNKEKSGILKLFSTDCNGRIHAWWVELVATDAMLRLLRQNKWHLQWVSCKQHEQFSSLNRRKVSQPLKQIILPKTNISD